MVKISEVENNSLASQKGIKTGDKIITINGRKMSDYIDFQFETAEPYFEMTVKKRSGEIINYEFERTFNQRLGIKFRRNIFDGLKTCKNDCIFCFVKQQPNTMRKSLLKKDDDYRFSFLQGSFITLTNLTDHDWQRIIDQRLSPLYISVHTTNPELRQKMMKNPRAADILKDLKKLSDNNIKFHTQIVLCPGLNDEEELDRTIRDLFQFYPSILSLGIVPVGLTKFRNNLYPLNPCKKNCAIKTLKTIGKWQNKIKNKHGLNWLFASDEFYFLADKPIPKDSEYGGYPQIENGIGLTRLLWNELDRIRNDFPAEIEPQKIAIVTGELGEKALNPVKKQLNSIKGLKISLLPIKNKFFSGNVSVTGLLTGKDILNYLLNHDCPRKIILPDIILNKEGLFLDDLNLKDIRKNLPQKQIYRAANIKEIMEVIKSEQENSCNSRET